MSNKLRLRRHQSCQWCNTVTYTISVLCNIYIFQQQIKPWQFFISHRKIIIISIQQPYYYYADEICFITCRHRREIQEVEQEWRGYLPSCSDEQAGQVSRSHCAAAAVSSGSRPDPHLATVAQREGAAVAQEASWDFQQSPDTAVPASPPAVQCTALRSWASPQPPNKVTKHDIWIVSYTESKLSIAQFTGLHSFTCHTHVCPQVEWAILPLFCSHWASLHLGQYSFPVLRSVEALAKLACHHYDYSITCWRDTGHKTYITCQRSKLTTNIMLVLKLRIVIIANQKTVEKKELGQNRIFRKRVLTDSLLAE